MRFTRLYPITYVPLTIGVLVWWFEPYNTLTNNIILLLLIIIAIPLGVVMQLRYKVIRD